MIRLYVCRSLILLACLASSVLSGCLSNKSYIGYHSITTPKVRSSSGSSLTVFYEGLSAEGGDKIGVNDFNFVFRQYLQDLGAFSLVDEKLDADLILSGSYLASSGAWDEGCNISAIVLGIFTGGAYALLGLPTACRDGSASLTVVFKERVSGKVVKEYRDKLQKEVFAGMYYGWGHDVRNENLNIVIGRVLKTILKDIPQIEQKRDALLARTPGGAEKMKPVLPLTAKTISSTPGTVPIVAVFDIEAKIKSFDGSTLDQLTDYMCSRIASVTGYRIVPREQLRERIIQEKRESHKKCYDDTCQIEMGKAMSAELSLSTKIIRVAQTCAMTSMIYDLKTETTLASATVRTGCSEDRLMDAIDRLSNQLAALVRAGQ